MSGPGRVPPRGGRGETESIKSEGLERSVLARPSPLLERGAPAPLIPEAQARADFQRRFGEAGGRPGGAESFFIDYGRIRGASGAPVLESAAMPFRVSVHRNNLYGGAAHRLDFRSPGQKFTLGSKSSPKKNYKDLHESASGRPGSVLVSQRDGYLHMRHRVEDLTTHIPDFKNLFRNQEIRPEQATIEERDGALWLRNLRREALVWVLEGSQWVPVTSQAATPLRDGSWILFGKNPGALEGNLLDPAAHTVLRVEQHRDRPLGPTQWRLIEFERREPAELEKIPAPEAYLGALLGQSPEWTAWRFRSLFHAAKEAGWSQVQVKELLSRGFSADPVPAELRLAALAESVAAARQAGWTFEQLRDLLFQPALERHFGLVFLARLPRVLEAAAEHGITPQELKELLGRLAKFERSLGSTLERLPELFREWKGLPDGRPPLREWLEFLDRSEVTVEFFQRLFGLLPGGSAAALAAIQGLIPAMLERYGLRGNTIAELSLEIVTGISEYSLQPPPRDGSWAAAAIRVLPRAFEVLFGLGFGVMQQREILTRVAEEQGLNFSQWWQALHRRYVDGDLGTDRGFLEPYLGSEASRAVGE